MITLTDPSHPGEVLEELFLKPIGMSATVLADRLGVPRSRIERLIKRRADITVDTAIRLSRFFSTTPEIWLDLQRASDLAQAGESIDVSSIVPLATDRESGRAVDHQLDDRKRASA